MRVVLVLLVALATFVGGLSAQDVPVIAFDESTVAAGGLTPDGPSIVVGLGKRAHGIYSSRFQRFEPELADSEGFRAVAVQDGVPPHSIWFAVDVSTGLIGVDSPEPGWMGDLEDPIDATGSQAGGMISRQREVFILLVRPPNKAWGARFADGGANDSDGEPGNGIELSLENLNPVANSGPPPGSIEDGDVALVVRPRDLRFRIINLSSSN